MNYNNILLAAIVAVIVIGCGTSSKTVAPTEQSKLLDQLVDQKSFEIQSEWAMPLATNSLNQISNAGLLPPGSVANRINLIGNPNHLRINGDSISAYLPYYGEKQFSGGFNNDNVGIRFNGVPKEYSVAKDENKQQQNIQFRINNGTENFRVNITLFPNMTATINVNSSHRFAIRYSGFVSPIEKELIE